MLRLTLALALLAAALDLAPRLTGCGGVAGLRGLLAFRDREEERGRGLAEGHAAVWRRHAARDRVVREVIAGRRPLRAAAADLRALFATAPPGERDAVRRVFPGCTEEESWCRAVVELAALALHDLPGADESVMVRLLTELQEVIPDGHPPGPCPGARDKGALAFTRPAGDAPPPGPPDRRG
jgi:hypothetical protein